MTPSDWITISVALLGGIGTILMLLISFCVFFLKKIVNKTDFIEPLVAKVGSLEDSLNKLCGRVEHLSNVRVELASLQGKFASHTHKNGKYPTDI